MKEITPGLPVKVVVDVLRQASKVNSGYLLYITRFYQVIIGVFAECNMFKGIHYTTRM